MKERTRLRELMRAATSASDYYRQHLPDCDAVDIDISDLPLAYPEALWGGDRYRPANSPTFAPSNGFVFSSSGTTGEPKFCIFSAEEWRSCTELAGRAFANSRLVEPGDCVANLAVVGGGLYSSFLFVHDALMRSSVQCTELALGNQTDADYIERIFHDCAPTVLIGMPLILLDLSDYLVSRNVTFPSVLKIGLGGELLKPNQAAHMFRAFPNAKLCGTVYASNECGLIGSWDGISPTNEICVADESVIVEIVDEKTHEPIEDINQPGLAVVTSIVKEKQPVIRYVTGDRVEWCSPKGLNRRMRLLGRATIRALNVEGVLISEPELWEIATGCGLATSALNVQAIVSADDTKTSLLFRLVMPSRTPWNISDEATVRAALLDYWPALHEAGVNVCVDRVTPTDSRKGTDMPKHKALVDLR